MASNIIDAAGLLKKYRNFTKSRKYKEATYIKTELTDLIKNHIDTTAQQVRLFGVKLRNDNLFLESILIFDSASTLSENIKDAEEKLKIIQFCVAGMMNANKLMIKDDAEMKVIVKEYVIPLMHGKLHYMESMSAVSKQYKCLQVSCVLHHIELSQGQVDQLKEREQTLREGLKRMDEVFGENKIKHLIYGALLNNLGVICLNTSRYDEAASFFRQTVITSKAATDYDDEKKRKHDIERGEENLRRVENIT